MSNLSRQPARTEVTTPVRPIRNVALIASALVLLVAIVSLFGDVERPNNDNLATSIHGLSLRTKEASSMSRGSKAEPPSRPPRPEQPPATPDPTPSQQPPPPQEPPPSAPPPPPAPSWADQMASEVLQLINAERAKAGCGTVHSDDRLQMAATRHSTDMAEHNYFDHTALDGRSPWDRARDAGYSDPTGENIAKGYANADTVVRGWMDSPGHRDNILNCASAATGLGVVKSGDGTAYWTQMFGST